MKRALFIIFFLLLAIVSSVFTRLNLESVTLNYYFGKLELPLALLLMLVLVFGSLLGLLLTWSMYRKASSERKRLRRTLKLREQEIRNLRDIPIRDQH